jgi:hypothetical protein
LQGCPGYQTIAEGLTNSFAGSLQWRTKDHHKPIIRTRQTTAQALLCNTARQQLTADVEELLAAHIGALRDAVQRDVGGPVAHLLGVGGQQRLRWTPLKVLSGNKTAEEQSEWKL